MTGSPAAAAPATIASACSSWMTLNAPAPRPARAAGPTMSPVDTSGIVTSDPGHQIQVAGVPVVEYRGRFRLVAAHDPDRRRDRLGRGAVPAGADPGQRGHPAGARLVGVDHLAGQPDRVGEKLGPGRA